MYVFFLKYYNINVHVLTTLATFTQQVEQNNGDVIIVLLTSFHAIMKTCYNLLKFTICICLLRVNGFDHVSLIVNNHDTHGVILSTPHRYTKEKTKKNKNKFKETKKNLHVYFSD